MACNCPTANHTKSLSGKPLGLGAYSIHLGAAEIERLYESTLADTTEEVRINVISFDMTDDSVDSPDNLEVSDSESMPSLQANSNSSESDVEDIVSDYGDDSDLDEYETASKFSELDPLPDPEIDLPTLMSIAEDRPLIHLTLPMDFEEYDGHISHPEVRAAILNCEHVWDGEFEELGYAPAHKLEDLLELCQAYPGGLANILQFKGRRFVCFHFTEDELVVYPCQWQARGALSLEDGIVRFGAKRQVLYTHQMTGMVSPFWSMIGPGTPSEPSSSAPHTLGTLAPTSDWAVSL